MKQTRADMLTTVGASPYRNRRAICAICANIYNKQHLTKLGQPALVFLEGQSSFSVKRKILFLLFKYLFSMTYTQKLK